jgi:hypothetical protein
MLFVTAWLVGWAFGEVFASGGLLFGKNDTAPVFLDAWLIGWTVGGGVALDTWFWIPPAADAGGAGVGQGDGVLRGA